MSLLLSHILGGALGPAEQAHLLQARHMQALSFAVHIPLVCFGIAFPVMVLVMEALGRRTGDPVHRTIARRWSKIMIALFAVGVITGTVLSFEMGILWPNFMATFGGVFGLGFAIEGFSFFLEAIFIGIYVYGWDRLSPRVHLLSGIPIVLTGFLGSWMVISVNAWMNHPSGFAMDAAGRVTGVHPWRALFANSYLWHEVIHMYVAAYLVTGFVMAGAYALARLRGRWTRYERTAIVVPLMIAAVAAPAQVLVGDWAARTVTKDQPAKLAAIEGLGRTTKGATLHVGGWYRDGEVRYGIGVPKGLSALAHHDPGSTVRGLDAVAPRDRPPVNVVRVAFQTMVGIGTALAALGAFVVWSRWRRRALPAGRWFFMALVAAGPAACVALVAGWVTTEVGRQPWVVYGVMRTEDAVTGAGVIPVSYATLWVVYSAVGAGTWWILRRLARVPVDLPVEVAA
jgi:cytochrome d ubiquinol oxidase subunit I